MTRDSRHKLKHRVSESIKGESLLSRGQPTADMLSPSLEVFMTGYSFKNHSDLITDFAFGKN